MYTFLPNLINNDLFTFDILVVILNTKTTIQ